GATLVVGLGNSGAEIALEVSRHGTVLLSGEPVGELPFRHGRAAARFALPFHRLASMHLLTRANPIGRRVAERSPAPPLKAGLRRRRRPARRCPPGRSRRS
ncbi:MAG TPA: hypothetical protein VFS16_20470, partial [Acidimicrobiia bacterium]|nr:hypothetical protein [Acidimicrobiia bacterium]